MFVEVLSRKCTLVGVAEANSEGVVAGFDYVCCGSGGGDEEEVVLSRLLSEGSARAARYRTDGNLHTCLVKHIVTGSRIGSACLVVLNIELKLYTVKSACGVDLVNCELTALLNGNTVAGSVARKRTRTADKILCVAACVAAVGVTAVFGIVAAARSHAHN